jgi:protein-tyrosine-phosphatase
MTLDQEYALGLASQRLEAEFEDVIGPTTVETVLHASYDHFAERAAFENFLPLMAERFARQRLKALAHVEKAAGAGVPSVLFLCHHNAGRSQMALGLFQLLAGDRAVAWSGGDEPTHQIDPAVVEVMAERGIDLTAEFPKPWTDEVLRAVEVIVTLGIGDARPFVPGTRYLDWDIPDPRGLDLASVRPIRDAIEVEVRALLAELGITPSDAAPR